jgi:hypothetical protein
MTGRIAIATASCIAALTVGLAANAAERPDAANAAARPGAVDTFVSGLGNDSNASANCPRTAPCRTLSGAYPVTQSGGDIIALDPADYGPLTITGPISILGVEGAVIAVASGTTGITINAPAGDRVVIRDLSISGAGGPNTTGIALTGGRLFLRNSTLRLLTTGLKVSNTKADLLQVDVVGNTIGISATGTGANTNTSPITGPTQVRLFFGSAVDNTTAYVMNNPGSGNSSILEFLLQDGSWAWSTGMAGNGTLVSGTGSGCPCSQPGTFFGPNNPN